MLVQGLPAMRGWVDIVLHDPPAAATNSVVMADAVEDAGVAEWLKDHPEWGSVESLRCQPGRWQVERHLHQAHGCQFRAAKLVWRPDADHRHFVLAVIPEMRCHGVARHATTIGDLHGHERLEYRPARGWLCPGCLTERDYRHLSSGAAIEEASHHRTVAEFVASERAMIAAAARASGVTPDSLWRMEPHRPEPPPAETQGEADARARREYMANRQIGDFDEITRTVYLGRGRSVGIHTLGQAGLRGSDIAGMGATAYDTLVRMGLLKPEGGK